MIDYTTIAALATPPGKGGVAVVRISGVDAYKIAAKIFTPINNKRLEEAKGYTAMFGRFIQNGQALDEIIALCFRAPKSYTGEDVVELQCHGGAAISDLILRACYENGAKPAGAGEFTKRAFLSGRISLTQAEAVMELINADGEKSAQAAANAMQGALYKEINYVRELLLELCGHIAAYTDYPEEDVPELSSDKLIATLLKAQDKMIALCRSYDNAAIIKNGIKTAIIGSPNVGKSTLLNLLSGFERAIVTPTAGTTRDVIEMDVALGGLKLILADTAGIRETQDEIEKEGIRRSINRMENADLIIAVFDASEKTNTEDIKIAKSCAGKNALCVLNKTDLKQKFDIQAIKQYFKETISISAKEREFLPKIEKAVLRLCHIDSFNSQDAYLANERQLIHAQIALSAISDACSAAKSKVTLDAVGVCIDEAMNALYLLTGENATGDIIDEVFSKFCVGK